jgi:hypothetical protein
MKCLLLSVFSISFMSAAMAEQVNLYSAWKVMGVGEIISSQATDYPAREAYRNTDPTSPLFNYVVRLSEPTTNIRGDFVPAGLYYCQVGLETELRVVLISCSNTRVE